jgi:hypothetical protein
MRLVIIFTILIYSLNTSAQILCGTASEGGTVVLTAPAGNKFTAVEFASYGTPNGSCGAFTISGCNSATSVSICSTAWVNKTTASVSATNGVFGDPCVGTVKRLYVQLRYAAIVPLTLVSFTAKRVSNREVRLEWKSENEFNTSHFIIERSSDGIIYTDAGSVASNGEGSGNYHFNDVIHLLSPVFYYRLKMVDRDDKFEYSNIVRINTKANGVNVFTYPNPADKFITVISSKQQEAVITNSQGLSIRKILLMSGTQSINIANLPSGIYLIKTDTSVSRFIKK